MGEARAAPKESNHPQKPPQNVTWGHGQRFQTMSKKVIAAVEAEKAQLKQRDAAKLKVAIESIGPTSDKARKILAMSKEAQARLISRLVQTQLMGEFLTIAGEQVNWRSFVNKVEADPLVTAAADIMADHVAGAGIYITADNDFAKAEVERFFENVGGPQHGGMESLIREAARDVHLYGIHVWQKYVNLRNPENPMDLRVIPLESIYRVHRDDKGNWVTMHQMPEYYGEPVEASRLVVFKWRPVNQNAFGAGIAQVMYSSRKYSLVIRDNTTGAIISSRSIIVPSMLDGRTMLYDIILKVFQRYGMPFQVLVVGDKDMPADQNIVENLVKPAFKRREEFAINRKVELVGDEIDPRTRFEAYINELSNLNIVTAQTPILKLWAAPEGMTEASARTALKAFDRVVLSRQRFIKRMLERLVIPEFLKLKGIDQEVANVRVHFGPIDKPELSYQDIIGVFNLNTIALNMANIEDPPEFKPLPGAPKPGAKPKSDDKGEAFPPPGGGPSGPLPMMGTPKPRKIRWVMTVGELRQNLRRYGFDLEEQMLDEEKAEPAAALGRTSDDSDDA